MPNPSGEPLPTVSLPGWRLIFSDDFDTPVPVGQFPAAVADRWWAYPDGWNDRPGSGIYTPSKVVSIHDGVLDKHLRTENGVHLIAAVLPKLAPGPARWGAGLPAGRYAVRFKADALPRFKTAWLLWPDSGAWPRDGEIDFPEGELNGVIKGFMHRQDATDGGDQAAFPTPVTYTDWHTAVIEWAPGRCAFYLDEALVGLATLRVPATPMHWVIQTQTELFGADPAPATAGHVLIDWVAVWVPQTLGAQMAISIADVKKQADAARALAASLTAQAAQAATVAAGLDKVVADLTAADAALDSAAGTIGA